MKFYLTLVLLYTSCLMYSQEVYNQELNYIFSVKVVDTTLYAGEVLELTVDNPIFQKGDTNYISAINGKFIGKGDEKYTIRVGMTYGHDGAAGSKFKYGVKLGNTPDFVISQRRIEQSEQKDRTLGSYPYFWGTKTDAEEGALPYIEVLAGKMRITSYNVYVYENSLKKQTLDPIQLHGQYLLDPNEFNGWGDIGWGDNVNSQKLSNVGATKLSYVTGGVIYPYDVRITRFVAWHRNTNAAALPWGFRIGYVTKVDNSSSSLPATDIYRECLGVDELASAPRNYLNTRVHKTDIDLSNSPIIPAGSTIYFGVESPTAIGTNYYVRIHSGFLEVEKI